ncbi:MAG: alpha/beta hydrolase [Lachnospiraceae bacterium]|nr:alpha/beta hydrolase [Lachnospiraceae bacterium]
MGYIEVEEGISLYYEEFGTGDNYILSAQMGFYKKGMQQRMAELGYHVFCMTIRGFSPSSSVSTDYGEHWYDVFAEDVVRFADAMQIDTFTYMGASHGAGIGWHLMLLHPERVKAFVAVVGGPHSLDAGRMSYRQMLEQGIIKEIPPFNPPIDNDPERETRRRIRAEHIASLPPAPEGERHIDYGRPLMRLGSEEALIEALKGIETPVLMLGGIEDPISTPELMLRSAKAVPHCKLVLYANCGHDIDTDLIEETTFEADRFLKNVALNGKCYEKVIE